MKTSKKSRRRALLSVHDVATVHLPLLAEMLADLRVLRIPAVNLAVVPVFHQKNTWRDFPNASKSFGSYAGDMRTEILLHGYYHQRVGGNRRLPWWSRFRSVLQSGGEDEFFRLDLGEAADRIRVGAMILEDVFGRKPRGFVPPAWAEARGLRDVLCGLGFRSTENHFWIYDLEAGLRIPSPVIAFSTRTPVREGLSRSWARLVRRTSRPGPVLRFVLHPADYGSLKTRRFALNLVAELSEIYDWCLSGEVLESRNERS